MGESMGAVATATSWVVRRPSSRAKPSSSATIHTDWRNPPPRTSAITLVRACSGVVPNSIQSRMTSAAP
jgi:hypothetical protein